MLDHQEGRILAVLREEAGEAQLAAQALLEAPGPSIVGQQVRAGTAGAAHAGDVGEEFPPQAEQVGAGGGELFAEAGQKVRQEAPASIAGIPWFHPFPQFGGVFAGRQVDQCVAIEGGICQRPGGIAGLMAVPGIRGGGEQRGGQGQLGQGVAEQLVEDQQIGLQLQGLGAPLGGRVAAEAVGTHPVGGRQLPPQGAEAGEITAPARAWREGARGARGRIRRRLPALQDGCLIHPQQPAMAEQPDR